MNFIIGPYTTQHNHVIDVCQDSTLNAANNHAIYMLRCIAQKVFVGIFRVIVLQIELIFDTEYHTEKETDTVVKSTSIDSSCKA